MLVGGRRLRLPVHSGAEPTWLLFLELELETKSSTNPMITTMIPVRRGRFSECTPRWRTAAACDGS